MSNKSKLAENIFSLMREYNEELGHNMQTDAEIYDNLRDIYNGLWDDELDFDLATETLKKFDEIACKQLTVEDEAGFAYFAIELATRPMHMCFIYLALISEFNTIFDDNVESLRDMASELLAKYCPYWEE